MESFPHSVAYAMSSSFVFILKTFTIPNVSSQTWYNLYQLLHLIPPPLWRKVLPCVLYHCLDLLLFFITHESWPITILLFSSRACPTSVSVQSVYISGLSFRLGMFSLTHSLTDAVMFICFRGEEDSPECAAETVWAPGSSRPDSGLGGQPLAPRLQDAPAGGWGRRGDAEEGCADAAVGHTGEQDVERMCKARISVGDHLSRLERLSVGWTWWHSVSVVGEYPRTCIKKYCTYRFEILYMSFSNILILNRSIPRHFRGK